MNDLFPSTRSRPALRYHGSKWRIAPWIISHFTGHDTYVEVFGGGAGVLQRKPRSKVEVYNDLDSQVFNFFLCLRDPILKDQLLRALELTPFAREEFDLSYEPSTDRVESARRFVTRCYLGHGTCSMDPDDSNGFRSCDIRAGKSYAREWAGVPSAIDTCASRFVGVTIENLDYRRLIPKFDDSRTLFYVDPPYPHASRDAGGKGYVHELSDHDHRELSWMLHSVKGKVAISGYRCRLFDELYGSWRSEEKKTFANGQSGAVSLHFLKDVLEDFGVPLGAHIDALFVEPGGGVGDELFEVAELPVELVLLVVAVELVANDVTEADHDAFGGLDFGAGLDVLFTEGFHAGLS